jgi:putative transposase
MTSHNTKQLTLALARPRKRRRGRARAGVPHAERPAHCRRHPVHVTLRRARALPSMRSEVVFSALLRALAQTARSWFRVVQFSIQSDHAHFVVEADDKTSLARGMTGLSVRLARAYNRVVDRRGRLWSERYHSRALKTPREVRLALVYVLGNWRKHGHTRHPLCAPAFDPCSSARWFVGWAHPPACGPPVPNGDPPVRPAQTWLASTGWRLHGLIDAAEGPACKRLRYRKDDEP